MNLFPVSLAIFYRQINDVLQVWTQVREDDGIYHGLLEFPGGGIEPLETPLDAAVREVKEEVGIDIIAENGRLMGIYPKQFQNKTVLLYVHLFAPTDELTRKGHWLTIRGNSEDYRGKIPEPNHQIIDDLYKTLYSGGHE